MHWWEKGLPPAALFNSPKRLEKAFGGRARVGKTSTFRPHFSTFRKAFDSKNAKDALPAHKRKTDKLTRTLHMPNVTYFQPGGAPGSDDHTSDREGTVLLCDWHAKGQNPRLHTRAHTLKDVKVSQHVNTINPKRRMTEMQKRSIDWSNAWRHSDTILNGKFYAHSIRDAVLALKEIHSHRSPFPSDMLCAEAVLTVKCSRSIAVAMLSSFTTELEMIQALVKRGLIIRDSKCEYVPALKLPGWMNQQFPWFSEKALPPGELVTRVIRGDTSQYGDMRLCADDLVEAYTTAIGATPWQLKTSEALRLITRLCYNMGFTVEFSATRVQHGSNTSNTPSWELWLTIWRRVRLFGKYSFNTIGDINCIHDTLKMARECRQTFDIVTYFTHEFSFKSTALDHQGDKPPPTHVQIFIPPTLPLVFKYEDDSPHAFKAKPRITTLSQTIAAIIELIIETMGAVWGGSVFIGLYPLGMPIAMFSLSIHQTIIVRPIDDLLAICDAIRLYSPTIAVHSTATLDFIKAPPYYMFGIDIRAEGQNLGYIAKPHEQGCASAGKAPTPYEWPSVMQVGDLLGVCRGEYIDCPRGHYRSYSDKVNDENAMAATTFFGATVQLEASLDVLESGSTTLMIYPLFIGRSVWNRACAGPESLPLEFAHVVYAAVHAYVIARGARIMDDGWERANYMPPILHHEQPTILNERRKRIRYDLNHESSPGSDGSTSEESSVEDDAPPA